MVRQVTIRGHQPGDIGWIISRHGYWYALEYQWDSSFEALIAEIGARFLRNFDESAEICLIGCVDDQPAGCAMVVRGDDGNAKLRLVLVEPQARGLGLGRKLVEACIAFSRNAGYQKINLWTNDNLVAARRIYEQAGFSLQSEEPHHSFGQQLTGQYWSLDLKTSE